MIETYLIEALIAFKEHKTLSKAAEYLHISQPALSRAMRKLEEEIGVDLFIRTKNSIALNENGQIAAEKAYGIMQAHQNMIDSVRTNAAKLNSLTIGFCAPGPQMELILTLKQKYPGIQVSPYSASEEKLMSDLEKGITDSVILSHPVKNIDYYCALYGTESLYISAVPAHPLSAYKDTGIHFSDVNGGTFLQAESIGVWDSVVRKMMPDARIIKQDSLESLNEVVNASTLLSFATDITLRLFRNSRTPGRVYIPINDAEASLSFYFVSKRKSPFIQLIPGILQKNIFEQ